MMWNREGYIERYGWDNLTTREIEVVLLRADGHTLESIASQLEISPETVKLHINRLIAKTYSTSSLDLISKCYKEVVIPRERKAVAQETENKLRNEEWVGIVT